MKQVLVLMTMVFSMAAFATEPTKSPVATPAVTKADAGKPPVKENNSCVKKDKNGKCPPLPKSPKPTPKKKIEDKK